MSSHSATLLERALQDGLPCKAERDGNYGLLQPTAAAGTLSAPRSDVNVAIPVLQERISPVLDTATRLLVVTHRRGKEVERKEVVLGPMPSELLAGSMVELRVDLLLCAALSEALLRALERRGIRVRPHLCGPIEAILRAFCCGRLDREEFRMPGCWGHSCRGEQGRNRRQGDRIPFRPETTIKKGREP
jgi:predicted Fe-Mo cluster-binding NifX family protein